MWKATVIAQTDPEIKFEAWHGDSAVAGLLCCAKWLGWDLQSQNNKPTETYPMSTENENQTNSPVTSPDSAFLVQRASAGGMTGGGRHGIPETWEQADFFNGAVERINTPNRKET
jgi:hypothetical protein